jgi:hypothetical protein
MVAGRSFGFVPARVGWPLGPLNEYAHRGAQHWQVRGDGARDDRVRGIDIAVRELVWPDLARPFSLECLAQGGAAGIDTGTHRGADRRDNMSITIPAQADDIRIVGGPTATDAQLIVAMQHVDAISGAREGWHLLQSFDTPPTLTQLRKRYPAVSDEYQCVSSFLGSCETIGTFVKQGLLHEGLVHDLYWIAGAWRLSEKACKGLRKEAGEPRLFENFELLASRPH